MYLYIHIFFSGIRNVSLFSDSTHYKGDGGVERMPGPGHPIHWIKPRENKYN